MSLPIPRGITEAPVAAAGGRPCLGRGGRSLIVCCCILRVVLAVQRPPPSLCSPLPPRLLAGTGNKCGPGGVAEGRLVGCDSPRIPKRLLTLSVEDLHAQIVCQ